MTQGVPERFGINQKKDSPSECLVGVHYEPALAIVCNPPCLLLLLLLLLLCVTPLVPEVVEEEGGAAIEAGNQPLPCIQLHTTHNAHMQPLPCIQLQLQPSFSSITTLLHQT